MNIAIIPARGGSKRLRGKNLKPFAGKPLIAWTIEAALQSDVFDHVFVSTDNEELVSAATAVGANVPFVRPAHLATDEASTNDVVAHLVEWIEQNGYGVAKAIAVLQPTSPLRNADHVREAFTLMQYKRARAVVSVCELEHPIQFCNRLGPDNSMDGFIEPDNIRRTQELESFYRLNGAIYLFDRDYVGHLEELYSAGTYAYIMSSNLSVDIDTPDDFLVAEFRAGNPG